MKIEQLHYLQEAVKYKSISLAAEKNFIAQSSLSTSLSKLEKELGMQLLSRSNTGVKPTDFGKIVLEKAEDIFKIQEEIQEIAKTKSKSGMLEVSCLACSSDWIIPEILQRLRQSDTSLSISITTTESRGIAQRVAAGVADFGILIQYEELAQSPHLQYTPLFQDEFQLFVGPASPYWGAESIELKELYKLPYIAYREEFLKDNRGLSSVIPEGFALNIVFRTDDMDSMKRMIAQYDYVAFFPKFMTRNDYYLKNHQIRPLTVRGISSGFEVGYVESTKYKTSLWGKKVIQILKEVIEEAQ
ncbi:MAG: LysR family transcriptional regulator [Lachnospiraceae bacterium]